MNSGIRFREAELSDSAALYDAHQDSVLNLCRGSYTEEQLSTWFVGRSPEIYRSAIQARQIWLAEQDGRVLGFVGFVPGEVTLLFVRQAAAGRGLGRQLFALGIAKAQANFVGPLTVVATQNSRPFYQAHGFLPVEDLAFVRGEQELKFAVVKMQRIAAG